MNSPGERFIQEQGSYERTYGGFDHLSDNLEVHKILDSSRRVECSESFRYVRVVCERMRMGSDQTQRVHQIRFQ